MICLCRSAAILSRFFFFDADNSSPKINTSSPRALMDTLATAAASTRAAPCGPSALTGRLTYRPSVLRSEDGSDLGSLDGATRPNAFEATMEVRYQRAGWRRTANRRWSIYLIVSPQPGQGNVVADPHLGQSRRREGLHHDPLKDATTVTGRRRVPSRAFFVPGVSKTLDISSNPCASLRTFVPKVNPVLLPRDLALCADERLMLLGVLRGTLSRLLNISPFRFTLFWLSISLVFFFLGLVFEAPLSFALARPPAVAAFLCPPPRCGEAAPLIVSTRS